MRIGDAREGLARLPAALRGRVDLLVSDVYAGAQTPAHLTTVEFFHEAAQLLAPRGVLVANVADGAGLAFARREVATVRAVLEHVVVLAEVQTLKGRRFGNLVVAASASPLPVDWLPGSWPRVRIRRRSRTDASSTISCATRDPRRTRTRCPRRARSPRSSSAESSARRAAPARASPSGKMSAMQRGADVTYIKGYDPSTLREIVDAHECAERLEQIGAQRSLPALLERIWLLKVLGELDDAADVADQTVRVARWRAPAKTSSAHASCVRPSRSTRAPTPPRSRS